jgi:hypothetical protein
MNFLIVVNSFSDASSSSVVEDWDEECKVSEPYRMSMKFDVDFVY